MPRIRRVFGQHLLALAWGLAACTPAPPQASNVQPPPPTLEQLLVLPGPSDEARMAALDQLFASDPPRCIQALATALPQMESWPVLEHACTLAVRLADRRLSGPLTLSLARPATSYGRRQRPEALALEHLCGQPLEDALLQVLRAATGNATRTAALDMLRELQPPGTLAKELLALPESNPFLDDVRWAIGHFDYIPQGSNEALWLRQLRQPRYDQTVARAAQAHRRLAGQSDYYFAPRFVHILAHCATNEPALALTRPQLLADLAATLATLKHISREPTYPHAPDDVPDTLAANATRLSRCDLLLLRTLLRYLPDPALRQELYRQGLEDMADKTSEHGGLLQLRPDGGGIVSTIYPPLITGNDLRYVPTMHLYAQAADALAFFHFHFQQSDNQPNAGPGAGDLDSVAHNLYTGVVITAVGPGRFNVDYFNPQGAVVDLGVYATP